MRAMVASLVVFLPGATLTTAVLELAAGQMVSGSSRLVSGVVQLALLSFGILAGIEAVGIPSSQVLFGRRGPARRVVAMARRARVRRRRHRRQLGPATVASRRSSSCSTRRGPASSSPTRSSVATSSALDRRDRHDGRLRPRVAAPGGDAGARLVPARVLAARPRRPRADRPHRAGRRRRRPGPRGHRRLHLRRSPSACCAVRSSSPGPS